jgi:hypothetical protein
LKNKIKKILVCILIIPVFVGIKSGSRNIKTAVVSENSTGFIDPYEKTQAAFAQGHKRENMLKNNYIINFSADASANITAFGMTYDLERISKDRPNFSFTNEGYAQLPGVTCFRGNNTRDSGSYGRADVKEGKLSLLWKRDIGAIDTWSGVGWNGQPAIVKWDKTVIENMNINKGKKDKESLKEVIYATLDGNVYFMDLEDGSETRTKLNIGAPIKGSLTVDPRGIPLLYVGQGINQNGSNYVDFAYRIFSLTNFQKLYEIKGRDNFARRDWGAFDSTALVDRINDYLFICGENGVVYSGKLNTKYENGKVEIKPEIDKYRYNFPGKDKKGIENSIAIYKNYGFFADNDGMLQCIDLKNLKPVWTSNVKDDTDSTIVLEKQDAGLNLYTACEVDHQGQNGFSYVRKFDAASGKLLWENKYMCSYNEETNGGALATPILGKGDIKNLVIFNIARNPSYNGGILVAIDKDSGKEVWSLKLNNYCWSSPLSIYTREDKSYIVQCDSTGKAMLIEGISGKVLDTLELGANVEGTPAAFEDTIVVGTRGCKIIGFKVK